MADSIKTWHSSCLKKSRYSTYDRAMSLVRKVKKDRGVDLRVYYCSICSGFHLTKQMENRHEPKAVKERV